MLGVQLPVHLRVDNTAALQLIEGKGANRTRHLRIRSSFVREKVEQGELLPSHVPGERQLADLLTKVLPGPRLQLRRSMIGMREREQRVPIDTIQGVESPDNHQVQSVTCTDALQRCLLFLVACLQVQSADGQDDEVQRLEVDPPYELMLLTALVVLSVLALWEGGRSPVQCVPLGIPRGLGQLLRFERASVEEKVQEAIKKELEGSGMRQRGRDALADSSSSRPVNSEPMPESLNRVERRLFEAGVDVRGGYHRHLNRPASLCLGSIRSGHGAVEAAQGIAALLRLLAFTAYGALAPAIHLRQLNPYVASSDCDGIQLAVEPVSLRFPAAFAGATSSGFGPAPDSNVEIMDFPEARRPEIARGGSDFVCAPPLACGRLGEMGRRSDSADRKKKDKEKDKELRTRSCATVCLAASAGDLKALMKKIENERTKRRTAVDKEKDKEKDKKDKDREKDKEKDKKNDKEKDKETEKEKAPEEDQLHSEATPADAAAATDAQPKDAAAEPAAAEDGDDVTAVGPGGRKLTAGERIRLARSYSSSSTPSEKKKKKSKKDKTKKRSRSPISSYGGLVQVPLWLPRPANYGQDFVTGGGSAPMGGLTSFLEAQRPSVAKTIACREQRDLMSVSSDVLFADPLGVREGPGDRKPSHMDYGGITQPGPLHASRGGLDSEFVYSDRYGYNGGGLKGSGAGYRRQLDEEEYTPKDTCLATCQKHAWL
eukprot:s3201_g2.t1